MRTIWKFEFETTDNFILEMPKGAELLCVQLQKGGPCIWAIVDSNMPKEIYSFRIFGTGHDFEMPSEFYQYIGTYQLGYPMTLVFHVFLIKLRKELVKKLVKELKNDG